SLRPANGIFQIETHSRAVRQGRHIFLYEGSAEKPIDDSDVFFPVFRLDVLLPYFDPISEIV
ncbi:hypothetical protein, partial [Acetobacter fabarum]|uniref:hypothetical protein n=1 Tax=Acetobacter fabarum TaxID=483199 RepID=UPI00222F9461